MDNPSVVVGHLSDEEIKKSIDAIVKTVDDGAQLMAKKFDDQIKVMEQSFNRLKNLKADFGESSGGSRRSASSKTKQETQAVKEQTQAVKEQAQSYDALAQAQQKAVGVKSARESYLAFMKGYKAQGEAIAEQIKNAETALNKAVENRTSELTAKLDKAKEKVAALERHLQYAFSHRNTNSIYNPDLTRTEQALGYARKHVEELQAKLANVPNEFKGQADAIEQMRQKREKVLNTMRDETVEGKKVAEATKDAARASSDGARTEKERAEAVERTKQLYAQQAQQAKQATMDRGLAAQKTAEELMTKAQDQMALNAANHLPEAINGVRELHQAWNDMYRAYLQMSNEEKASPVGLKLKEDMDRARAAFEQLQKYNWNVIGKDPSNLLASLNQTDTVNQLTSRVKQLTKEYNSLTTAQRDSAKGMEIADKIQKFSYALKEIRSQLNRPISLDSALKLTDNTLERIAYKLQQLNAYRMGINIDNPSKTEVEEMKKVEQEIDKLKKKQDELLGKNKEVENSNNALARSWNYMKNRLAFYFTVGASTQFIKNLIEIRSQYEMNERALGILIGSAERGTQIFNELSKMALVSPYTLIELSNAARQFTAYDVAARDVVDTTRRMADISAAVGIPMERLTYALGQIKAYGYLNSRDARMFLNAGIPLVKSLAEHYTELEGRMVSVGDVYDRIKKKAVGYNDVMQVIYEMTDEGGRFFDFQAKMADTLKVQLANLTLAWNNMLNDIGKSNQGVLVNGIKFLKEMFLHWKDVDKMVGHFVFTLGAVKAAQLLYYFSVKGTNQAIALETVLGKKLAVTMRAVAASLKAIVTNPVTWWLLLAAAVVEAVASFHEAKKASAEFHASIRDGAKENLKNITQFVEQYKSLRDSLWENVQVKDGGGNTTNIVTQSPVDIDKKEAVKAWEEMREQIELSVAAGEKYVAELMQIDNVSERLRQGFALLDDLQAVNAALSEIGDNTIFVQQDFSQWWNLWMAPDSLDENVKDVVDAKKEIEDAYGSIEAARAKLNTAQAVGDKNLRSGISNYDNQLATLRKNIKDTTDSMIDFINLKGWQGDTSKISQFFDQFTQKTISDKGMNPQEAFLFQQELEEAKGQAMLNGLNIRIKDEKNALKAATDEETKYEINERLKALNVQKEDYEKTTGVQRAYWGDFTKWMKEQHISEMTAMFRDMDAEQIKSLNFQSGQYGDWVKRMVTQYAKEHKMSYDEAFKYLKHWVASANTWSIFIPLTISTEERKSVKDQLEEYDKQIDEADAAIERLTVRKKELEKITKKDAEQTKEYAAIVQELSDAEKAKAEAEAKGGHGKKEKKDEKAGAKARKEAESELMKALKEELSLIDNIRNNYKKLTKECETHTEAIERAVSGYDKTVNGINKVLQKYGVNNFNPSDYAGVEDPNKLVELLKAQITALISSGLAKTSEIKDLEVKIQSLEVEARSYNLKKVTDGLNNELSKLKDEYELALELDADPILGEVFKEMFNIDPSGFPNSIDDYMDKVQGMFDSERVKNGYMQTLDVFKASEQDWKDWAESVGISEEALKSFSGKFIEAQGVAKKWAENTVKETENLQYKLADTDGKIAIENEKLQRLILQREKSTNEEERKLLDLKIKDQTETIARLGDEVLQMLPTYKSLFNSIADHSAYVTRKIAKQWKEALESAKKNADGTYTITDPKGGTATIGSKEYGKQVDKVNQELRKTASTMANIKEAFTKGEDGEVDFAKGLEYVAQEAQKAASGIKTIAEIVGFLGGEGAEESVEVLNDIATSMEGVGTAMQGYAKIQSGDVIGGAVDMIKGTWSAVSTWLDNGNKKIDREIKKSENAVKDLELAYKNLERTVEKAYGTAVIGAQKVAIANKEAQLAEVKRQLKLEESRDSKHRDENRIRELRAEIIDLENEIADKTEQIVNDLLGISSVGDAMESLMDGFVEALRSGEDAMKVFDESVDDMIANMVKKMFTTKILTPWFEQQWETIQKEVDERGSDAAKKVARIKEEASKWSITGTENAVFERTTSDPIIREMKARLAATGKLKNNGWWTYASESDIRKAYDDMLRDAENALTQATTPTTEDIEKFAELLRSGKPIMEGSIDEIKELLVRLGLMKDSANKNLSALQQGIQGVTENTAGAIEAYMNSVSQQVYLHSDLLVQIRDAVVAMDSDAQLGVQAQMLLQLQQSYAIQVAIQGILAGWSNPSGLAVRVEMV